MSALTIDPAVLTPQGAIGRAEGELEFHGEVIAAINDHAELIDNASPGGYFLSVTSFGAVGDGVTLNNTAFAAALAAADLLNAGVFVPAGTYMFGPDGANSWSIDYSGSGLLLFGVPGQSVLRHRAGMPASSVALLRLNGGKNITIRDLVFDGNWGNAVTEVHELSAGAALPQATINVMDTTGFPTSGTVLVVIGAGNTQTITYTDLTDTAFHGCTGGTGTLQSSAKVGRVDANTGINHSTQADPRNYLLMLRGTDGVSVENCDFNGAYGDMLWTGFRGDPIEDVQHPCRNTRVIGCRGRIAARHSLSISQSTDGFVCRDSSWMYPYGFPVDSEPQTNNQYARNATFDHCYFGLWWNPGRVDNLSNLSAGVKGGNVTGLLDANAVRNFRFVNGCVFEGSLSVSAATGLTVRDCFFLCDFDHGAAGGVSYAPIFVDHVVDFIDIIGNYIYDRGKYVDGYDIPGDPHGGCIVVQNQGDWQPAHVNISHNSIRARNGRAGIKVSSTGGFAGAAGGFQRSAIYTATGITASTITVAGAGWVVNAKASWNVYIGGLVAQVESNTSDTLTLSTRIPSGGAWNLPQGGDGTTRPTPALGTMTLTVPSGTLTIDNNTIDCSDDGNGQGSYGIALYADRSGMRVRVRGNNIKNAVGAGVYCSYTALTTNPFLEVCDNTAYDDQPVVTCNSVVQFANGVDGIDKLILRNNIKQGGVRLSVAGLTSGVWMEEDGEMPRWAGYATPENVIRAAIGSTFRRRDGGAGTCFYVKEQNGTAIDVSNKADSAAISVASGGTLATYIPTVTTTVDACLIVMALAAQPGSGTGDFDSYTNAALTSITEIYDFTIAGCLGVATGIKLEAGATGVTTARNNGSQTVYGPCGITIALRPEAPDVPPVYVATGVTQTRTTNGTMTVAWPVTGVPETEVQEGDYALMVAEFLETDTLVLSTAEGFTELPTNSPALGTFGGTGGSRIRIWECRAFRPSMTSPQITYTAVGVPAHVQATIFTFRGASLANAVGWVAK